MLKNIHVQYYKEFMIGEVAKQNASIFSVPTFTWIIILQKFPFHISSLDKIIYRLNGKCSSIEV